MKEFICPNGKMSVNGICEIFSGNDPDQPALKKSTYDTIIEDEIYSDRTDIAGEAPKQDKISFLEKILGKSNTPKSDMNVITPKSDMNNDSPKMIDTQKFVDEFKSSNKAPELSKMKEIDKISETISPKTDMVGKKVFEWDMDKITESAMETADNIIKTNTEYYNEFVEKKLGLQTKTQEKLRALSSFSALAQGKIAAAVLPFAAPFILGGQMKNKEIDRIQKITDQDTQGDIKVYDVKSLNIQPTSKDDYMGSGGKVDTSSTKQGQSRRGSAFSSSERGRALHG
jgi:hypothetical protein|tara:strand:- start:693 stop:1547 length:855 start_codon:yes stop_codon:yes gene_type:complete